MRKDEGYRKEKKTRNYNNIYFFQSGDSLLLFPHMNNIEEEKDNINPGSQNQFHFRYVETCQTV